MNNEFITKLKNSSFLPYLGDDNEVIMIYLGGSRCFNMSDQYSDYDIVVVTKNQSVRQEGKFGLKYQGKSVHWYYRTMLDLILPVTENWELLDSIAAVNLYALEDNIIYINNKYLKEAEFILQHKKDLATNGAWNYALYNDTYHKVKNTKEITPEDCSKLMYHLCNCHSIIFNKELNTSLCIRLKRLRRRNFKEENKEDLEKVRTMILEMDEYYKIHEQEIKNQRTNLINKLKEVL